MTRITIMFPCCVALVCAPGCYAGSGDGAGGASAGSGAAGGTGGSTGGAVATGGSVGSGGSGGGQPGAPDSAFALDEGARTSGMVTAVAGGTITAPTGDTLHVPPGALNEDVTVTLTPYALPADAESYIMGGVQLEPDGLALLLPAQLTLALAETPTGALKAVEGPASLTWMLDLGFAVDSAGTTATGDIYGFSGHGVSRNCHGGTQAHLLTAWQGLPERSAAELAGRATNGLTCGARPCAESDFQSTQFDPRFLQQMMGDFFVPCGDFSTDVPLSDAARAQVTATVDAGRMVVTLFGPAMSKGQDGLYEGVSHSAVVVNEGGELVIRNRLNLARPKKPPNLELYSEEEAAAFTVEAATSDQAPPIVDLPFAEIDAPGGMRGKKNGEVTEDVVGHSISKVPLDQRPRAWSHVVLYCEKPRDAKPCSDEPKPNGSCGGNSLVCIGTVEPCADPTGSTCCPADMCNYSGLCVQIMCPGTTGRNYDCECCCTAGMGAPGSCDDTATVFNHFDTCRGDRLCACGSAPATDAPTCGP